MPVASSLANAIDSGVSNFLTQYYGASTETLSRYLSFLGETGTTLTNLYADYLNLKQTLIETGVSMGTDLLRFGSEMPLMFDDIGSTYQAFELGDLKTAGMFVGSALVRGYREGSRALLLGNITKTTLNTATKFFTQRNAGIYQFSHQNPGPLSDPLKYPKVEQIASNKFL